MDVNPSEPLLRNLNDSRAPLKKWTGLGYFRPHHDEMAAPDTGAESFTPVERSQRVVRRFLTSRTGHYAILGLVSLDVSCIFADFIITIFTCRQDSPSDSSEDALEALAIISLIFSSLFVLELLASIWAFGLEYFKSKFHVFDAFIISASFIIDVLLRGPVEEVASLIIVLRLWRVVKIIEELSVGAQEEMEGLQEKVQLLEQENEVLKRELQHLRSSNAENR